MVLLFVLNLVIHNFLKVFLELLLLPACSQSCPLVATKYQATSCRPEDEEEAPEAVLDEGLAGLGELPHRHHHLPLVGQLLRHVV